MLNPSQLRSLRTDHLDWSAGVMCDELGWTGKNATSHLIDMETGRKEINMATAKHALRIAREQGFELRDGNWQRTG